VTVSVTDAVEDSIRTGGKASVSPAVVAGVALLIAVGGSVY